MKKSDQAVTPRIVVTVTTEHGNLKREVVYPNGDNAIADFLALAEELDRREAIAKRKPAQSLST
jgi:hypothetical protein